MTGAAIAAEVADAIRSASAEVGTGAPLTATIERDTGADEGVYPPTPGTTQTFVCDVVLTSYSARDRDGTNIRQGDAKAMIAPDAETAPLNGDKMRISGRLYSIESVEDYRPGGVTLYWIAQVRESGQPGAVTPQGPGFDSGFSGGFS